MSEDPISATLAALGTAGSAMLPMLMGAGQGVGGFLNAMLPATATGALTKAIPTLETLLNPTGPMQPFSPFALGSQAGGGILRAGEKILPDFVTGLALQQFQPPSAAPISMTAPEMPMRTPSAGPPSFQAPEDTALSLLLRGLVPPQTGGQGYGYRM